MQGKGCPVTMSKFNTYGVYTFSLIFQRIYSIDQNKSNSILFQTI